MRTGRPRAALMVSAEQRAEPGALGASPKHGAGAGLAGTHHPVVRGGREQQR